jgi:solute carrier family 25 (adenine nucleotide translocator) protein 4/5/6/31
VKEYKGTIDCIRKVYNNEGLKGFWKGAYTNAIRSIGSSICLVLFDELKALSSKKNTNKN